LVNFTTIPMLRKVLNISWKIIAVIFILLMTAWVLIHFSPVQTWLVKKVTHKLSAELGTKVAVKKVDFSVFKKLMLEGVYIEDHNKDTLLYAGRISVGFNNWFIFKDKTIIHEADLEYAKIYLHRKDSIWNYAHISKYLSSDKPQQKNSKPLNLSLKNIHLSNIDFYMKDEWIGEDIKGYLGQIDISTNKLEFEKKIIDLQNITIDNPSCTITEYNGNRPPKRKLTEQEIHAKQDTSRSDFLEGWTCKIKNIHLNNGTYSNILDTSKPTPYFDPTYIVFNNINASVQNIQIVRDSILGSLELSAKERSGFDITSLKSNINWHARAMEFHQLKIETPYSKIGDFFAMRYLRFNHDMNHFIDHIQMEGNLLNSKLHTKDLAFFAPALSPYNEAIFINGLIQGKVNNLISRNLTINNNGATTINGKIAIQGLPDVDKIKYDLLLNSSKIEYNLLAKIIPDIKNVTMPKLSLLGNFNINGSIKGFNDSLKLGLSLQTALGNIGTNINFLLPAKGIPKYKGTINTEHFNLGQFINLPDVGNIDMNNIIEGSGFDQKNLAINIKSTIPKVQIRNNLVQNITIDASIKENILTCATASNDANLNLQLASIINFKNRNVIRYNIGGGIKKIDFYKLGLTKNPLSLSGNIDADFAASNINDFDGFISLNEAILSNASSNLPVNNIQIQSELRDNASRRISIHSDILNVNLEGIYHLDQLNGIGNQIMSAYFPAYFMNKERIEDAHIFTFDLETKNIDKLLSMFKIPIHGTDGSFIRGSINTTVNQYKLNVSIPDLFIQNISIKDINLQSDNDNKQMNVIGDIGMIQINDSLRITKTQFNIQGASDTGFISIKTAMSQSFKNADLRSRFSVTKDGVLFNFLKSNFVLNEKIWNIDNESDLYIGKNDILSDGIIFTSGNESIKIFTHPSDIGAYNDLTVEIRKVELGELLPYFFKDPRIEGTTTGRIDVSDPFGNLSANAIFTNERLRINNDSIGLLPLKISFNQKDKTFRYSSSSDNIDYIFNIKGFTNISNLDSIYTDNIIELSKGSISLLEPYLEGIISDMKGEATGLLNIKGFVNNIKLTGNAKLGNASFMLDYTKCKYNIQSGAYIEFTDDKITFNNILFRDFKGRQASFNGNIKHAFFNKMIFDLHFEAMNKNKGILVLNTTAKDNSLFYGNVTAYMNGSVTGPLNNIKMKISGRPTDSSKIFLPTSDSRVTSTANFIVFRQYGEDLKSTTKIQNASALNVDLDVIANPYAKVYLILDEVTNDIIEGQGNGAINLKVGTYENVSITGNYEITNGKYTFNWQDLFKRPFLINKGTISWSGNPYDARINIDANYLVEQVRLPNELTNGCNNERNNILVVANLSNTLQNPTIKFRFELPQGHPCRNNPLTNNGLAQLYNNPDELNRQVISLLLIGSFISGSQNQSFAGGAVGNTFFASAAGTLSEFLSQQITSGLGAVIRNIPGLKDLKLDPYVTFTPGLITGTQAEGIGFQGTGSFGFTRKLMNGRLLMKAGGSMLVAAGQTNNTVQNNRQLTPDISIEWLITPDGKLRLIGFYRTIFDIQRRNDRTGVSFSYLKEFDKIW